MANNSLDDLLDPAAYPRLFMEQALWEPYVREVCARHNLPCQGVRTGVAGTYPTFIVDDRWVVKFFGALYDGWRCFQVESQAAALVASLPRLLTAPVLAQGFLLDENASWHWPYLVFQFIPGVSIGEVYNQVSQEARLALAAEMGGRVKRLHELPLPVDGPLAASWDGFACFLRGQYAGCAQRQAAWGSLAPQLAAQIPAYLPPLEELLPMTDRPRLVHADLTRDHLLGTLSPEGRWKTGALIDFGDARAGSPWYELPALHLDLFNSDKRLLRAFFEAYGWEGWREASFPRRAMAYTLLHEFNVLVLYPQARDAASLEALAEELWRL
jgi:aminoglycoside phosphotransferase (APT) family kinase protein